MHYRENYHMRDGYIRYFLGFIIAIGLIIALIILLFNTGSSSKAPATRSLSSFSDTNAVTSMTIDGPINAPQNHNSIVISIDRTKAVFQQYQGYDGTVINTKTYDNTQNSYNAFLHALGHAGFTQGDASPDKVSSTGQCPLGQVYTFKVVEDGKDVENLWATSCGGAKTYNGNTNMTISLFEAQIPDYNTLISNVTL